MAISEFKAFDQQIVLITKQEYDRLLESKKFLLALQSAGVDNWEGYHYATKEMYSEEDEA